MASVETLAALRRMIDDVSAPQTYDDATLELYLADADDELRPAAGAIWREKAAKYVELVDVQEGTSRRALSAMLEHALAAADAFDGSSGSTTGTTTTRPIERV